MLKPGVKAPEFSLPDQEGKVHALSDYKGDWVLLYFYPKDDTPGCTTEACVLRDAYDEFGDLGMTVLGVSADSVKSHSKFALKHQLPFTLLSDEEKKVIEKYGAWGDKKMYGREYKGIIRMSFLIDPEGKIAKIYPLVKPAAHADEVRNDALTFMRERGETDE